MPGTLKKLSHLSYLEKMLKAEARVKEKACKYKHEVLNYLGRQE